MAVLLRLHRDRNSDREGFQRRNQLGRGGYHLRGGLECRGDRADNLVDEDTFDDPRTLAKLLRSNWNTVIKGDDLEDITVGEYIDAYQEQG